MLLNMVTLHSIKMVNITHQVLINHFCSTRQMLPTFYVFYRTRPDLIRSDRDLWSSFPSQVVGLSSIHQTSSLLLTSLQPKFNLFSLPKQKQKIQTFFRFSLVCCDSSLRMAISTRYFVTHTCVIPCVAGWQGIYMCFLQVYMRVLSVLCESHCFKTNS